MNTEFFNEKWYSFLRIYCKDGYIDRWTGDCFDDPNKDNKSRLCGNMSSTWYRLNKGRWYHKDEFTNRFQNDIYDLSSGFAAAEIFISYFRLQLIK